jgi:predicted N-acetyltransferase YhbS
MDHALNMAQVLGHVSVLLVGDEPYYSRFGFSGNLITDLHLPGPVERNRFLGLELNRGALEGAQGLVVASGAFAPVAGKILAA